MRNHGQKSRFRGEISSPCALSSLLGVQPRLRHEGVSLDRQALLVTVGDVLTLVDGDAFESIDAGEEASEGASEATN